jgi:hypothetical protein
MKRIVGGIFILLVIAGIALALYARSVLTGDTVRAAVAAQVSSALGQPVTIGGLGASIYPRVTMDLTDVTIGGPGRVHLSSMHLGTGLRALFSRRIEGAAVRIDGARISLPLPVFTKPGAASTGSGTGSSPVEIVSIDEIVLRHVEVVSGERTLRGSRGTSRRRPRRSTSTGCSRFSTTSPRAPRHPARPPRPVHRRPPASTAA